MRLLLKNCYRGCQQANVNPGERQHGRLGGLKCNGIEYAPP